MHPVYSKEYVESVRATHRPPVKVGAAVHAVPPAVVPRTLALPAPT
jgi:hypothetical protein